MIKNVYPKKMGIILLKNWLEIVDTDSILW